MNSSSLPFHSSPAPVTTPPAARHHLLTRRHTERLLWREEWRTHAQTLSIGVTLWVWLYLVPGESAQSEQLLGWSVTWAGLCAMLISGRDLRQGIDPLIRTLAPPHHLRWHMRTAIVLAASLLFYIMGLFAVEGQWATTLWSPIADGPFTSNQIITHTFYAPWHGVAIISAIAVTTSLAASCAHGMFFSISYSFILLFVAHNLSDLIPPKNAQLYGFASLLIATAMWIVGSHIAKRRGPIATKEQRTTSLPLIGFSLSIVAILFFVLGIMIERNQTIPFSPIMRQWLYALYAIELTAISFWWFGLLRNKQHRTLTYGLCVTAFLHLAIHLWTVFYLPHRHLRESWPSTLSPVPSVHIGQTVAESRLNPSDTSFSGFDILLFTHPAGTITRPISLITDFLPEPALKQSTDQRITIALPGHPSATWQAQLNLSSRKFKNKDTHGSLNTFITLSQFSLSPEALHLGYHTYNAAKKLTFYTNNRQSFTQTLVAWNETPIPIHTRIIIIPRPEGIMPTEVPWNKAISGVNERPLFHTPSLSESGISGLTAAPFQINYALAIPLFLLASVLIHTMHRWHWALLGITLSLLFAMIALDGLRQDRLRAIVHSPVAPESQREAAERWLWRSYFHQPKGHPSYFRESGTH